MTTDPVDQKDNAELVVLVEHVDCAQCSTGTQIQPAIQHFFIIDPIHQAPSVEHAVGGDSFLATPILLTLLPQVREDHADSSWDPT